MERGEILKLLHSVHYYRHTCIFDLLSVETRSLVFLMAPTIVSLATLTLALDDSRVLLAVLPMSVGSGLML